MPDHLIMICFYNCNHRIVADLDINAESLHNQLQYTTITDDINTVILKQDIGLLAESDKIDSYTGTYIIRTFIDSTKTAIEGLGNLYNNEDLPIAGILYKQKYGEDRYYLTKIETGSSFENIGKIADIGDMFLRRT